MDQKRIGAFIAKCRKEKNLTQMQLAELLGITNQAVSKWENGRGMPDMSLLQPLCIEKPEAFRRFIHSSFTCAQIRTVINDSRLYPDLRSSSDQNHV